MPLTQSRTYWERLRENSMIAMALELGVSLKRAGGSSGRSGMFVSPWREDNNASLHIRDDIHGWTDFGDTDRWHIRPNDDKGYASGDSIDFVSILLHQKLYQYLTQSEKQQVRTFLEERTPASFHLPISGPLSGYTLHSPAPNGKSEPWLAAMQAGGVKVFHTPNVGDSTPDHLREECYHHVLQANKTLRRRPDSIMDILARYWLQVRGAEAVVGVGRFSPGGGTVVEGGPAWAIQMGIDEGKSVYFFDEAAKGWWKGVITPDAAFSWEWLDQTPILPKSFAAVCAKNLTDAGRQAIRDAVDTLLRLNGVERRQPVTIQQTAAAKELESIPKTLFSTTFPLPFTVGVEHFPTVEHFLAWTRCGLAGDSQGQTRILSTEDAISAREIASQVNIPDDEWKEAMDRVLGYGLLQGYLSNPQAAYWLLLTGNNDIKAQDNAYPSLTDKLSQLRTFLYESCNGNISEYRSGSHWVVDGAAPGFLHSNSGDKRYDTKIDALVSYMTAERHIEPTILSRYCLAITAHRELEGPSGIESDRAVVAVGFPNTDGGFELRKEPFTNAAGERQDGLKACTSKNISIITSEGLRVLIGEDVRAEGDDRYERYGSLKDYITNKKSARCWVFEGFTDFLSALSWSQMEVPPVDCIILNSTSQVRPSLELLQGYQEVVTFLDNDTSGREATSLIQSFITSTNPSIRFIDGMDAPEFRDYKDVNDAWSAACENDMSISDD